MQTLTFKDGTVVEDANALLSGDVLFVYMNGGLTMEYVFNLLNDPEKTDRITSVAYGAEQTYEGYTDLFCIRKEENGEVNAGLRKAVG